MLPTPEEVAGVVPEVDVGMVMDAVESLLGEATTLLLSPGLQHVALCREVGAGSHHEEDEVGAVHRKLKP